MQWWGQMGQLLEVCRSLGVPLPVDGIFTEKDIPMLREAIEKKKRRVALKKRVDSHWNARKMRRTRR